MKRLLTFTSPLASLCDVFTILIAAIGLANWTLRTAPVHASPDVGRDPYVYLANDRSDGAAWDCNHTINVAINAEALPLVIRRQTVDELSNALETISSRSRFTMKLVGTSTEFPTMKWGTERLNVRTQADVVVFIGDPAASDLWDPGKAAVGGSFSVPDGDMVERSFAGYVMVDSAQLVHYRPGSGYLSRSALFTHELLHVLGLGHTRHPSSMMTPRLSESSGVLGEGDIAGLQHLAGLGCGY